MINAGFNLKSAVDWFHLLVRPRNAKFAVFESATIHLCRHFSASKMTPREIVQSWVAAFNRQDSDALAGMYAVDAVNHQVAESPVQGRERIREMFVHGFALAKMVCIVENLFEEGNWAILEWRDPLGLRGCGFFKIENDQITLQRGYWDKLSFLRLQGLPLPPE